MLTNSPYLDNSIRSIEQARADMLAARRDSANRMWSVRPSYADRHYVIVAFHLGGDIIQHEKLNSTEARLLVETLRSDVYRAEIFSPNGEMLLRRDFNGELSVVRNMMTGGAL